MTKQPKKPTKRTPTKRAPGDGISAEGRASEAVTVGWTLAFMAAALADLAALLLWLLGKFWPGAPDQPHPNWLFLPTLALFIAAVSGLVCLALTPAVYRLRSIPPPPAITLFAVVVSGIPLGVLAAMLL